jgi:hypothetical protein
LHKFLKYIFFFVLYSGGLSEKIHAGTGQSSKKIREPCSMATGKKSFKRLSSKFLPPPPPVSFRAWKNIVMAPMLGEEVKEQTLHLHINCNYE